MVTDNNKIKQILKEKKIPYWKICDKIGMAETTLCVKLRKPVSEELAQKIEEAITDLTKQSDE